MGPIDELRSGVVSSERLNQLVRAANLILKFNVGGEVDHFVNAENVLALVVPACNDLQAVKLTGGGTDGLYAWTEQVPIGESPWWDDGERSGTVEDDPAIEVNGNEDLDVDLIVPVWRANDGTLRFRLGVCS